MSERCVWVVEILLGGEWLPYLSFVMEGDADAECSFRMKTGLEYYRVAKYVRAKEGE